MSRCEIHTEGPLANQCDATAVLGVMVITGVAPLEETAQWVAHVCTEHAWEGVATAAHQVGQARSRGEHDARVVAIVEEAGEQLLRLLQGGATIGDRWPLAEPWVER